MSVALAASPALPLHTAGKYVAAAYIVLFLIVLIYVAIMALRLSHLERDLGELLEATERKAEAGAATTSGETPGAADGPPRESTLAYPIEGRP
jgi:hypothetical protein